MLSDNFIFCDGSVGRIMRLSRAGSALRKLKCGGEGQAPIVVLISNVARAGDVTAMKLHKVLRTAQFYVGRNWGQRMTYTYTDKRHNLESWLAEKQRFRKLPPTHYTFEIESFSSLLETKLEKYETKDFEAGGYNWRMVLYPKGKKKEYGSRHISLFLAISEPAGVSLGWEVNVAATFFVYDGIRDRYLAVQDNWRFHKFKAESCWEWRCLLLKEENVEYCFDTPGQGWGFREFMLLSTLKDPSTGYLVNDCMIVEAQFGLISVVTDFS
ncbi:unnamed protein product [Dovyalis caffra]|uniref:MATH domain-containing protein n=1 Tax=Dovyalis caffra TaxID=77055 RepID=A0AAV1RSU9_9ROSI|nr:unnamed protein product [Dovyalis caffra]